MVGFTILFVILLALSVSGYFLKHIVKFDTPTSSRQIPLISILLGIVVSAVYFRSFQEAVVFLLASTLLWASYVFGSRLRQRGSFFWNVVASFGTNGLWYITMHILDDAKAYWLLFILYTIGIVAGRIAGVGWAQLIEQRFKLKADATNDPKLAPGQRLNYIKNEPTFWVLVIGLVVYITYGYLNFETEVNNSVLIVVGLGLLQNLFYALQSRAGNRGNNWYIAVTSICSGTTFFVSATYLFSKDMTMVLFIPYVLSTSLGTAIGAFFSMMIEWVNKLRPDAHLKKEIEKGAKNPWGERLPYLALFALAVVWIIFQKSIFNYFDYPLSQLKFPLTVITYEFPRWFIVLTAAFLFFIQEALHTLASRAGNRNHTGYHVTALIPKGLTDFLKLSYLSLNSDIPEIIPVAVLGSCLGSLYGKDVSERIEIWLQARMDVVEESKTKTATA